MKWNTAVKHKVLLLGILLLALGVRVYGLNWDQNNHLHPDERFLTMVAGAMHWPKSIAEYFDTQHSQLNPHNIGYRFYVYGTYPVIWVKYLSYLLGMDNYNDLTLVGRFVSAALDTGTVLLVYLMAKKIFAKESIGLWSAFIYGICVLPIQLSHFFAVDTYLVFFTVLAFYLVLINKFFSGGISQGLAVAAKISGIYFLPVLLLSAFSHRKKSVIPSLLIILGLILSVRITYPYLFDGLGLNQKVLQNWRELKSFEGRDIWFPPAVQWINTKPIIYPLKNLALYGVGVALFVYAILGWYFTLKHYLSWKTVLISLWVVLLFIYQGSQFAKPLRYFYVLYPFLALFVGVFFECVKYKTAFIILGLIWPLAFLAIYTKPHSRVKASEWIVKNITTGSVLTCEHWDDCLPLGGGGRYQTVELPMFNPDTQEKWTSINQRLDQSDFIILSSNRVYGSISAVPERYPTTTKFYQDLFAGKVEFTRVAEFTSRPNLFGREIVDDAADETFTVYDHPRVIIFAKQKR